MKILYITHDTTITGAGKALSNIILQLRKEHDIRVLCPSSGGALVDFLKENGVIFYFIKYRKTTYPRYNGNPFVFIKKLLGIIYRSYKASSFLEKILKDYRPDIVHTNTGTLDIALSKCRKLGIPHVWHLREYQDKDFDLHVIPSKKAWLRKIHQEGNYNIAITKDIFNYFQLRDVDTYIYDGVFSTDDLPIYRSVNKSKYFLFVGRIEESKGLYDTLAAFKEVSAKYPDYQYYVAGRIQKYQYYEKCNAFVVGNHLEDKVIFLGERNDVYELMAHATALLVPSRCEGFGFITVEAMLNDCLVIGRNTGGTKEQLDNGVMWTSNEIGLRYETKEELISRLLSAIECDFSDMRNYAYKLVIENYSQRANVKALEGYYRKILSRFKSNMMNGTV